MDNVTRYKFECEEARERAAYLEAELERVEAELGWCRVLLILSGTATIWMALFG